MIDFKTAQPTTSIAAFAIGAALIASQIPYPTPNETFQNRQVSGTYSAFMASLHARSIAAEPFAIQISEIYNSLASRQERLGDEFEAAIFNDLEGLYEA